MLSHGAFIEPLQQDNNTSLDTNRTEEMGENR